MKTTTARSGTSNSQPTAVGAADPHDLRLFLKRFALRGRDPAVADENLYRYCLNEPTDATDPDGEQQAMTPGIRLDAPVYRGRGIADAWNATIVLPSNPKYKWGMVIQKVISNYEYNAESADGKKHYLGSAKDPDFATGDPAKHAPLTYWEMWAVLDGKLHKPSEVPGKAPTPGGLPQVEWDADTFGPPSLTVVNSEVTRTYGSYSQIGELIWVPKTRKEMENAATYAKWQNAPASPARGLYYSASQPDEWKLPGEGESGPDPMFAIRAWTFKWCYDKANPTGNYDAAIPLPKAPEPPARPSPKSNGWWQVRGQVK